MKLLNTILLCFCGAASMAQTTLEEYNYLTEGYPAQKAQGLDMKQGYMLEEVKKYNSEIETVNGPISTEIQFMGFYRIGEPAPCAYLAIYKRTSVEGKEKSTFICIPHAKSDPQIWSLTGEVLQKLGKDGTQSIAMDLMKLLTDHSVE